MKIEVMIYVYSAICISMILFNTACILGLRRKEYKLKKLKTCFKRSVNKFLSISEPSESVYRRHKGYLRRKLRRSKNLLAFDSAMEELREEKPLETEAYFEKMHAVFLYLALEFQKKDDVKITYLAYLICKYKLTENSSIDTMLDIMFRYLDSESLYCRENALKAIYASGDINSVVRALHIIDKETSFHNSKLIADGLLHFSGDLQALCLALWEQFDSFGDRMRVTLLNFMRFSGDCFSDRFLRIMRSEEEPDEERFSAIRFFGKYYHKDAYPCLIRFAKDKSLRWEYQAIASTALAVYPSAEAISVLKDNLHSANWYIRYNASGSLERLGITYSDLAEVFSGGDRYAKEIMQFRLEQRESLREERREKDECQTVCSVLSK